MTDWTDERVGMARRLWTEGLSASQIAARLGGVTRNAVLGKIGRMGLLGTREQDKRATPRRVPRAACRPAPRIKVAPPAPAPRATIPAPDPLRVSLIDLAPGMCRWPIGDPREPGFGFCGCARADGSSYCGHHAFAAARAREGSPS